MQQLALFDDREPIERAPPRLPSGLTYEEGFLSEAQEQDVIALLQTLPLSHAHYKGYTARRRVLSFGARFDFARNELQAAPALIEALLPLRERVAHWAGLPPEQLAHTLVSAYDPQTPLGWHRDVPDFEEVFGVSLGAPAVIRWRPYPHRPGRPGGRTQSEVLRLEVAPRSIYAIRGAARWQWQHSVAPVAALRWSLTFRTLRQRAGSTG
ncbi:MAG: alpha-ketoglutarate-dependent dioxygenase AlkB [Acidobacteriota bacterium]